MIFNRYFCTVAATVLACLIVPQVAKADPDTNQIEVAVAPDFGNGAIDLKQSGVGAVGISGSATGGFSTAGNGIGSVNYGVIKLAGELAGSGDTLVRGIYNDQITITSASVANGTAGTLTFGVSIAAALNAASGASSAGFTLTANVGGGAYQIDLSGTAYAPEVGGYFQGTQPGVFLATASFVYGQATTLSVEVQAISQATYSQYDLDNNITPYTSFDLSHSSYWQGISDVTANGSAVSDFSVSSLSGTNWANSFQPAAAPEPMTILLPIAGGLLLLRRKRN